MKKHHRKHKHKNQKGDKYKSRTDYYSSKSYSSKEKYHNCGCDKYPHDTKKSRTDHYSRKSYSNREKYHNCGCDKYPQDTNWKHPKKPENFDLLNDNIIEEPTCECDCNCYDCYGDKCDCECDCMCDPIEQPRNVITYSGFKISAPRISVSLPRVNLPSNNVKIRLPRGRICERLPRGQFQTEICGPPETLNQRTVATGTLNVCVIVLPGAIVGTSPTGTMIPDRVTREIAAANNIWQRRDTSGRVIPGVGVRFNITNFVPLTINIPSVVGNAENFPTSIRDQNEMAQRMFDSARRACSNADVFIFYMDGNRFGPVHTDGTVTQAVTFGNVPVIIMTNGSTHGYVLAHELGHFMFNTNRFGSISDPEPFSRDNSGHNRSVTNLMYPSSTRWPLIPDITAAQVNKALNSRVFYD